MVSLDIAYTIKGSKSQGTEKTGFFSGPLILYKINDEWHVGVGGNLPKPSMDEIKKAL